MFDDPSTIITGYPGRLARAFACMWPHARRVGRADFDIRDRHATVHAIEEACPRLVINCAALTDMSRCEAEPNLAWEVNVRGVRNLAEGCKRVKATLVHFSSDYALDPVNEYAWTKRSSESLAHLTVRAKIYDESHRAWVALRNGQPVRMLTNEFLNPISTKGLAVMTEVMLARGIRGLVAAGTLARLSFWQVGRIWAEVLGAPSSLVEPIEQLNSGTPRLAEMFLDTSSLRRRGVLIQSLEDDARQLLESLGGSAAVSLKNNQHGDG